ncbi:hypothetical protein KAFR_0F01760 [Kazachstania africana CBS 2517]|uniref:Uncharacterized protein n=1 Tax=Kazachstania africana (strain ATCC 22294 / BCRC 22015 / CBS 2517 / CECT 1963 / NBRC 1671 / NRRL Y-8276) TaxID=1071382 RepID=H2AWM3_KAZAF|nr:hypothetical protein KAFR_0F01760 [Kazachstania africana CBS 2517]CCF58773.1 hypothetical protein KAFR_0F01760 [Kazachstania africana CBS 2517]
MQRSSSEMDSLSNYSNSKFLIAPFDEETQIFDCHCQSCMRSEQLKKAFFKFFWIGVIIPIFWIINLGLYFYIQWYLRHDVYHPKLNDEEFPTLFQSELKNKRSLVRLKDESMEDINSINASDELTIVADPVDSRTVHDNDVAKLKTLRFNFLKEAANQVINSHDKMRKYYRTWTLRSILGLTIDIVIIIFVVLLCTKSSQKNKNRNYII